MADYKVVYPELGMELEERISGNALVNLHDLEAIFKELLKLLPVKLPAISCRSLLCSCRIWLAAVPTWVLLIKL